MFHANVSFHGNVSNYNFVGVMPPTDKGPEKPGKEPDKGPAKTPGKFICFYLQYKDTEDANITIDIASNGTLFRCVTLN